MYKSYWFTKKNNLTPNIRKHAISRRIVKSLTAAAGSKQQNFCARGVPKKKKNFGPLSEEVILFGAHFNC